MKVEQISSFLMSIMKSVQAGRCAPAATQREYRWGKLDVLDLCDSVMSGLPIGSMLTWEVKTGEELAKHPRLGPIALEEGSGGHMSLILDGHNRLATLAWMLEKDPLGCPLEVSRAEREVWMNGERLVLDAHAGGFIFVPADEAQIGLRIPASSVVGTIDQRDLRTQYARWREEGINSQSIDAFIDGLMERAERNFMECRISDTRILNATTEEAKAAFLRVCRAGVPISEDDFDRAAAWNPNEEPSAISR